MNRQNVEKYIRGTIATVPTAFDDKYRLRSRPHGRNDEVVGGARAGHADDADQSGCRRWAKAQT